MCMPIHSEKAARNWTEEKLNQIASLPERYPMNEGLKRYIESERLVLQDDLRYWQRYEGWLMDWDAETLALKAPEVRTDTGVKAVVRALTPKRLRAMLADMPDERVERPKQLVSARADEVPDVRIGSLRYVWRAD